MNHTFTNDSNSMKSFDRTVLRIILILIILILGVILLGDRVGVLVDDFYPTGDETISINGKIGITFDEPMIPSSVEERFEISPTVQGEFVWEANTLWFLPREPLIPEQIYQASVSSGAVAENGRQLQETASWQVHVRQPDLLYLVVNDIGGDLWRFETSSGSIWQLTDTFAQVSDFSPSHTGDWIAFSQTNNLGGSDLWLTDRQGSDSQVLVACDRDRCDQASWATDGIWIAYVRESYDIENERYEPSRIWTVHVSSGETTPLYEQENVYSHSPSFSPDGKRLASYDITQNGIRILNLETSQEAVIPSVLQNVGDWSPDGKKMIFVDLVPSVLEPNVGVYIVDFTSQEVQQAFGEFIPDIVFSQPQWSPKGEWVAVSLRPVNTSASKAIWLHHLDGFETRQVTDDPSATYSAYRWDPWGEQLVFQRFETTTAVKHPSIWLWDWETGESRLLVEKGARPEWLP